MQPNIIESFISAETCKYINDYFIKFVKLNNEGYENIEVSNILPYYDGYHLLNSLNKNLLRDAIIHDLLNTMIQSVASLFNVPKNALCVDHVNYRRFGSEQSVKGYHIDFYGEYGASHVYTALLYLNDDYEGGDIVFYDGTKENITGSTEYSPKTGSLFYFEGNEDYAHSINPVKSGERSLILFQVRVPTESKYIKD
jgi:hypothetical protein